MAHLYTTGSELYRSPGRAWARISAPERERIRTHGLALAMVLAAALLRWLIDIPGAIAPLLFFTAAVGFSASIGGAPAATTATLASMLLARGLFSAPWLLCAVFVVEAAAVAAVIVHLSQSLRQHRDWLDSADASLRSLKVVERRSRVLAAAFNHLQDASLERVAVTLDREGRIVDWGDALIRLYGVGGERVIGLSGAELFGRGLSVDEFDTILSDARKGVKARAKGRHQRSDGTPFDVEIELNALPPLAGDGFTLLIHDLSGRQASELAARLTTERQQVLREEADVAQRQITSLQGLTDPSFDALPTLEAATALLERLRGEVSADGIAILRTRGLRPAVFSAADGVQPEPGRIQGEARAQRGRRTLLIHNDPVRVCEMTAVGWPDEVRSLIAVPILRGGEMEAMVEVAYLRGRRSTDWEITLIQIAAGRAVGLLHDVAYAKTGAVA